MPQGTKNTAQGAGGLEGQLKNGAIGTLPSCRSFNNAVLCLCKVYGRDASTHCNLGSWQVLAHSAQTAAHSPVGS